MTVLEPPTPGIPTPDPRTFDDTSRPFAEAVAGQYARRARAARWASWRANRHATGSSSNARASTPAWGVMSAAVAARGAHDRQPRCTSTSFSTTSTAPCSGRTPLPYRSAHIRVSSAPKSTIIDE